MKKKRDKQSQPLRIEHWPYHSFITSRCLHSKLWFVNNEPLEDRMLGYLAKYSNARSVKLYSFVIMGNHYHMAADFRKAKKASYFRDFNARTNEAVKATVPDFEGGPLFERRYSEQALPTDEDLEERFFYCALQAVHSGLCEKAEDYPGYNSFFDAINGVEREVKVVGRFNKLNQVRGLSGYLVWVPGTLYRIGRTLSRMTKDRGNSGVYSDALKALSSVIPEISAGAKKPEII